MSPSFALTVVGRGRVGIALAMAFEEAGLRVESASSRVLPDALDSPVYLFCVRDAALGDAARRVLSRHRGAPPVMLHTAGGVSSAVLREAGATAAALMHPLVAFADARAPLLSGALFAIEGDTRGRAVAETLAQKLGGRTATIDGSQLARYHAAAVLASNHVLALVDLGQDLLTSIGIDPALAARGLESLFGGVAANLTAFGLPGALTGPIARGDLDAVDAHLRALAELPVDGGALAAYLATAPRLVELARRKGVAAPAALDAISTRLSLYVRADLN